MKKRLLYLFTIVLFTSPLYSQNPEVTSVSPSAQSLTSLTSDGIFIHFTMDMDPGSVNDSTLRVFGRWSGPMMGSLEWENGDSTLHFTPDEDFFFGEWIIVNLSRDIEAANNEPIAFSYSWNYWTISLPGSLTQNEIDVIDVRLPGEGNITCYGAYAGDINNDGYSDFTVANEVSNDLRLFLNDENGSYDDFEIYEITGDTPSPSEGADFNNDGQIDIAVANTQNDEVSVLFGDGIDGYLEENIYLADANIRAIGILDADGDGDDDIVTANRFGNNMSVLINNGSGSFEDPVNIETGGNNETSLVVADANEDGIMDVFVGAYNSQEIILMLGDGNGSFTIGNQVDVLGAPWMLGVGDVNNDGHVDVLSSNSSGNNVAVILGDGLGNLEEAVEYSSLGFPIAMDLGDIDGDGDLDMMSSNYSSATYRLYENMGDGSFEDPIIYNATGAASCTILHDRDNDGDLDISGIDEIDDVIFLYENDSLATAIRHHGMKTNKVFQNYPNPFSNYTDILYSKLTNEALLNVYTLDGKIIHSYTLESNTESYRLSANTFTEGLYYYEIIQNNISLGTYRMMVVK